MPTPGLSEPWSELVVYVYLGQPWYHAGRAYHHAVPRVGRRARVGKAALRRRGKFPSLFSTTSFGRSWHQFGSTSAGHDGLLNGGALGGFD